MIFGQQWFPNIKSRIGQTLKPCYEPTNEKAYAIRLDEDTLKILYYISNEVIYAFIQLVHYIK